MEKCFKKWLVVSLLIFTHVVFAGSVYSDLKKKVDKEVLEGLKIFSEALPIIKRKSFRNVDVRTLVEEALKSCVSKIDPHSAFISNFEQMSDTISGNFSGIGVSVINKNNDDEHLLIIDVLDDSPAQKAGMLAGDKVVAVDGQKLRGLALDEVVSKMRGKRGTRVKLKILRSKKIMEIEVLRDTISDRSSFGYHFSDQNIYYVNLKSFSENAPKQMKKLIETINGDGECRGLILDLRSNPGGVMESAVDIASLFVPKKSLVVSTRNKKNRLMSEYFTMHEPVLQKKLLFFVLVNNFTASAAEILAGALRYHSEQMETSGERESRPQVFIVGVSTFGKGSVQEVIPLSKNHALKLTSMLYFLPDGESIQAKGVKPDFPIMPMRGLSTEERFLHELYGLEKTMYHHITAEEVKAVGGNDKMEKHSVIDKKTAQLVQKLEDAKSKSENAERSVEKELSKDDELDNQDFVDEVDRITSRSDSEDEEDGQSNKKIDVEKRQRQSICQDHYIKTCINMISHLSLLKKTEPKKVETLRDCREILSKSFMSCSNLNMKKLKEKQ